MEWIILGLIVVGAIYTVTIYNRMVAARNQYKNAFAQIDVQLTRRHDLIPNLVETAKGYLQHERQTLTEVIEARNAAVDGLDQAKQDPTDPERMQQLSQAEQGLSGALGRLFALAESYPDLKADQNMQQLSEQLTTTENKVAFARQSYNDSVMNYNTLRESFPNNLLAGPFNFGPAELLEIEDESKREVPEVSFT